MNNRRPARGDRGGKPNTGRTNRGSGRNSGPQNVSSPTTSLKSLHGLYANQHFVYIASVLKGCTAELQVKSGKKFEGILSTVSPTGEVELRLAHPVDSSDGSAIPSSDQVAEKMLFKAPSIVQIDIKDVDMDFASRGADAFQTDAEIARRQNGQISDRELEAFETDGAIAELSLDDPLTSTSSNGWSAEDMFKKNELMGVTSSYDSNLGDYTTVLEMKDTEDYQKKIRRADRIAKQIEGSSDYTSRISKELECSEEDRFSAVVRGHSSSPSPVSASSNTESLAPNPNRYVPPALRHKQDGMSNPNNGPPGHHRNHPRGTPPPMSMNSPAGRARAQSPHMHNPHPHPHHHHPPHPQQPHPGPSPPHGMPHPHQHPRVQTPPHSHPQTRSPQMPVQMPSPQQPGHLGNPRSPTGIPSSQPLPQRVASMGRRMTPDVGPGMGPLRSPVQSPASASVVAPMPLADKQSPSVDKSREGAGPQDVDTKPSEVLQSQRVAPPVEKSPRTSMTDSSKRQIEQFKEFKDNFRLPEKDVSGPPSSTTAVAAPTQQITPTTPGAQPVVPSSTKPPQQQQPPPPSAPLAAVATTSQPAAAPTSVVTAVEASPITSTTAATPPTVMASPMSVTTASATTTSAIKPATPTEDKKDQDVFKKSTLNPNAKEFNPHAKPFTPAAARIAQKTPTPPRPPSQPSPAPQPILLGNYAAAQQMSQPLFVQQPNIQYGQIRGVGHRKGGTNLPIQRQHDIHHPILPVSMAAGQPLVTPMPPIMGYAPHQAGPGVSVSAAQPMNQSQVLGQQQPMPFVLQQKQMAPRLANQQNLVAAQHGQHGNFAQDQQQYMVFPMPANINTFQHSGNLQQQTPGQMAAHYHPIPQAQSIHPHHPQNPQAAVHLQQQQQQQQQQHQAHPGPSHPQPHPHTPHQQQHTTPPLAHTSQGGGQGGVMQQQQQQPGHGGRPSPSPVNQAIHQANQQQQQQHQQQQHQQQQQQAAFHPQGMQGLGQPQPHNAQMMAAMAAVNHQGGAGGNHHGGGNPGQGQNLIPQMPHGHHPTIIHYPQTSHGQVPNLTNVTPVHTTPHPHPKQTVILSTPGGHSGPGMQQSIQAIPMHPQPSIMPTPVQGPYVQTPQGQLHQAQVQQYQTNN